MTRYILTQDMKAIIPFMDGDQIKAVKRPFFRRDEKAEKEEEAPYDVNVYFPDGKIVRGCLGTFQSLTWAKNMITVLFDRLADDSSAIIMLPDEDTAKARARMIENGGYVFYNDDFSLERAFKECKAVFDGITDSEKFQEADTGAILYHAGEILYALNAVLIMEGKQ